MNSESKKEKIPCECGWLDRMSTTPGCPIIFDTEMNEFHLKVGNSSYVLYYCPFCGGSAPASLRDTFFYKISAEENERLNHLADGISSRQEWEAKYGPPRRERLILDYPNLSETAFVTAGLIDGEWKGIHHMPRSRPRNRPPENKPAETDSTESSASL